MTFSFRCSAAGNIAQFACREATSLTAEVVQWSWQPFSSCNKKGFVLMGPAATGLPSNSHSHSFHRFPSPLARRCCFISFFFLLFFGFPRVHSVPARAVFTGCYLCQCRPLIPLSLSGFLRNAGTGWRSSKGGVTTERPRQT